MIIIIINPLLLYPSLMDYILLAMVLTIFVTLTTMNMIQQPLSYQLILIIYNMLNMLVMNL